jgi:hypothetical protein
MLRSLSVFCLLIVAGCGTRGVRFDGRSEPRISRAEDIREMEALPEGYTSLGEVRASCEHNEGEQPTDALLSDVDCTETRLTAALRERAAEAGGELLVARHCRSKETGGARLTVTCSAEVARPSDDERAMRPLAGGKLAEECDRPRASEAWSIQVRFERNTAIAPRKPRHPDSVREVPLPPLSHVRLGDLVTRCASGCTEVGVRQGLVAAAGAYGANSVVDVHCVQNQESGWLCTGVAMAYEVDPERNAHTR